MSDGKNPGEKMSSHIYKARADCLPRPAHASKSPMIELVLDITPENYDLVQKLFFEVKQHEKEENFFEIIRDAFFKKDYDDPTNPDCFIMDTNDLHSYSLKENTWEKFGLGGQRILEVAYELLKETFTEKEAVFVAFEKQLTVDYETPHKKMIDTGRYYFCHKEITPENFPIVGTGIARFEVEFILAATMILGIHNLTDEYRRKLLGNSRIQAGLTELLAFGVTFPKISEVIATGQNFYNDNRWPGPLFPAIRFSSNGRRLATIGRYDQNPIRCVQALILKRVS